MKKLIIHITVAVLLFSVLTVGAFAVSESESNDSRENADPIELKSEVIGKLHSYSDRDFYVITVPSDGYISVDFIFDTPYVYGEVFKVYVYHADGSTNVSGYNMYWKIGRPESDIITSTGVIGLRAGIYYIEIRRGADGSDAEYKMKVNYTETEFCEIESNHTMLTATDIELNQAYSGSVSDASDVDWYCINVPDRGCITVDFSHDDINSSKSYWSMWIYKSDGVTSVDGIKTTSPMMYISGNETEASRQVGLSGGTYYVKISSGSSYTYNQTKYTYHSNAAYTLKVSFNKNGFTELEPNQNAENATPVKYNETYVGALTRSSDEDWYSLELLQDGYITVSLENKTKAESASVMLRICYGSRYTDINGYDKNNGADSRYWEIKANESGTTSQIGLRAGTYYIWVESVYNDDITYSFKVNYTQSVFTEHEPNMDIISATSIDLNKAYFGSNAYSEDEDWYSIHLLEQKELTLRFDHSAKYPSVCCWTVYLYGTDGETVLKTYEVKGDTKGVWSIGTLPAERYFIKVTAGNQLQTDVYSLNVTEKHDCSGELTVIKAPTCTEEGEGERTCSICGARFERRPIPAVGHSFGGWITDTAATCSSIGKCHRECTVCKTTESDGIPMLAHKFGEWEIVSGNMIIPPIVKEQKCELCGATEVTKDWGYVWVTVLAGIGFIGLCFGVIQYIRAFGKP